MCNKRIQYKIHKRTIGVKLPRAEDLDTCIVSTDDLWFGL